MTDSGIELYDRSEGLFQFTVVKIHFLKFLVSRSIKLRIFILSYLILTMLRLTSKQLRV